MDSYILYLLHRGAFDLALSMDGKYGGKREYIAEASDTGEGWIVGIGETGLAYEYIETEREARILALWHSLDDRITFDEINDVLQRDAK